MVRNGDVEATIVKARCGSDVRKLNVHHSDDLSHNDLLLMMQRIFKLEPTANVVLKYKDQDGDYVTLADDNDLILALQTEPSLSLIVLCNTVDGSQLKKLEQQLQDLRDSATNLLETLKSVDNLALCDQKTEISAVGNALKSNEAVATIQPSVHEQVNNSMMTTSFPPSIHAKEEPLKPIEHHQEQVLVDGSLIQSVKPLENANVQSLDSSISSRESSHIEPPRSEVDLHSSVVQQNVPQFPPLMQQQQHQQYLEEIGDHTVPNQHGGQPIQSLKQSSPYMPPIEGQQMSQPSSQHPSVFASLPPPHHQQQQQQQQQFYYNQQHSQSVTPTIPTSDYHFGISSAAQTMPTYNTMSNTAPRPPIGTTPPLTHQQPMATHPPPNISQSSPFSVTSGNPHGAFVAPQRAAFGVGVSSQAPATPFGVSHPPQHNPIGMQPYSTAGTGAQQPPPSNVPSTMPQGFGRSSPSGFPPAGPPTTMFGQMSGGVNPFARGTNPAHHMRFHPPQQQ